MFPRSDLQYVFSQRSSICFLAAFFMCVLCMHGNCWEQKMIWPRPTMYHIDLYIGNRESAAIMPTLEPQCCCPDKNRLVFLWVCTIERSIVGINGIQWVQRGFAAFFIIKMFPRSVFQFFSSQRSSICFLAAFFNISIIRLYVLSNGARTYIHWSWSIHFNPMSMCGSCTA